MQLAAFYVANQAYPKVVAQMKANWAPVAEKWAWWGRLDILDLQSNTNNLVERNFGLIKYTDLGGKTQSTIHELIITLLTKTVARNIQNRALMLAGRTQSDQQRQEQRTQRIVDELVAGGAVQPPQEGSAPGLAWVQCSDSARMVCLGDLSCSCSYSGKHRRRARVWGGVGRGGQVNA